MAMKNTVLDLFRVCLPQERANTMHTKETPVPVSDNVSGLLREEARGSRSGDGAVTLLLEAGIQDRKGVGSLACSGLNGIQYLKKFPEKR